MKITLTENLEIKDGTLKILYSYDRSNPLQLSFNYTCPSCAGHGCSPPKKNVRCLNGEISIDLNPEDLPNFFKDDEVRGALKGMLESLSANL